MIPLSETTAERLKSVFPEELWKEVEDYLKYECGDNIPYCEDRDKHEMERIRFAVLKLSEGRIDKLIQAIELAQVDWRDLFMAAGFGHDIEAHKKWRP